MCRFALSAFLLSITAVPGNALSLSVQDCVEDLLVLSGTGPAISEAEIHRLAQLSENFGALQAGLSALTENTVSFNEDGEVSGFKRFRRDEVLYSAIYICLKKL
jgi:hypothetical protein